MLGSSFSLIFLGYLSVDREKLKLRNTFTRYLGEDVMEEALKNPDKLNQGEKRDDDASSPHGDSLSTAGFGFPGEPRGETD